MTMISFDLKRLSSHDLVYRKILICPNIFFKDFLGFFNTILFWLLHKIYMIFDLLGSLSKDGFQLFSSI